MIITFILGNLTFSSLNFGIIYFIIIVFGHVTTILTQTSSNIIPALSIKVHDYKLDKETRESHPLNEGFILLPNKKKTPLPTKSRIVNRTSTSHNISTTTCKTVTTVQHTSTPTIDHSVGHVGRRLLYQPSYDTDIEASSKQIPIEDPDEIDSFLKIDDEELSKQLFTMELSTDGSGDSMLKSNTHFLKTYSLLLFYSNRTNIW
jgi:hypothetical protein